MGLTTQEQCLPNPSPKLPKVISRAKWEKLPNRLNFMFSSMSLYSPLLKKKRCWARFISRITNTQASGVKDAFCFYMRAYCLTYERFVALCLLNYLSRSPCYVSASTNHKGKNPTNIFTIYIYSSLKRPTH